MRLSFFGAAGEVTGSCYLLETVRARVLIDFGLHQGDREADRKNRRLPPINPDRLDAVVLTHAHVDHSGRLPLLTPAPSPSPKRVRGSTPAVFTTPIFATPATIDLTAILLRDAAHLQASDAERESRRRLRQDRPPVTPLYTIDDVDRVLRLLRPLPYDSPREIAPGVTCRFVDAGHILGSASVELTVQDRPDDTTKVLVFSADLGPRGSPLLRDPVGFEHTDVLVLESTYGDRDHRPLDQTVDELAGILAAARDHAGGGKVLIPAFAVGRTQQLIYFLGGMRRDGRFPGGGGGDPGVYVDSPMAIEATELYRAHKDLFDDAARRMLDAGDSPLRFPGLRFMRTAEQSASLNTIAGGAVVISASGMCNGGRILHHLKHSLWREQTHLVIVGFQAQGTLGRQLVDGATRVNILGEPIAVKAKIHTLGGFSAHAGQTELVGWAARIRKPPSRVFLTHGEDGPRKALAAALKQELGFVCERPRWGDAVDL
jgi:metallo-beta-lactamase family protein